MLYISLKFTHESRSITTGVSEQSFLKFLLLDIAKSSTSFDAHPRVNTFLIKTGTYSLDGQFIKYGLKSIRNRIRDYFVGWNLKRARHFLNELSMDIRNRGH